MSIVRRLRGLKTDREQVPATGGESWLSRAVFEAALIVFSILAALGVSEWRDARERRARAETALAAIKSEIEANLQATKISNTYNNEVIAKITEIVRNNERTIPPSVYPKGLFVPPTFVATAWESIRGTDLVTQIPFALLLRLGETYQFQERYQDRLDSLLTMLYAASAEERNIPPDRFRGILRDHVSMGGSLERRYETTLWLWNEPEKLGSGRTPTPSSDTTP